MSQVRVAGFGVSLDGFSAGIEQSLDDPLGKRGPEILSGSSILRHSALCRDRRAVLSMWTTCSHDGQWKALAPSFLVATCLVQFVAHGPTTRGRDGGANPPYHAPTFVLTHYEREPLVMEGGTTFYFVSRGIEEALRLAKQAAGDKDVKIGGGVSTVRQYLQAGLVDSLHFALAPVALGQGEALFPGIDLRALGFSVAEHEATEHATHVVLTRR